MKGQKLIEDIIQKTGLPEDLIKKELHQLVDSSGHSKKELSLEELREILCEYLQETLIKAKGSLS